MPVQTLGHAVDMEPLLALATRFELTVVEDATEALGTLDQRRPVGSLGHAGCFSFNGNQLMTAGSGGMVVGREQSFLDLAR